ncbi:MAG: rRNA maturation RNase YbeY [Bacilli bacterium]|nr:rRNA maturation RNase YbeY [Bacilli bacterium]
MNNVEIINETEIDLDYIETMRNLINYAIEYEKIKNVIFNIIIVDNNYIHKLNKEYRGIDQPTDVISFALEDNADLIQSNLRVLGDIYISIDKVYEQAKEYGHSNLREICFLMIHGFLHLLGYDHMEEAEEKVMFAKQEEILNGFGITR